MKWKGREGNLSFDDFALYPHGFFLFRSFFLLFLVSQLWKRIEVRHEIHIYYEQAYRYHEQRQHWREGRYI